MRDFWPFLLIFCAIFGIFVVLDATRIVPHACIAHVSCFQSRLRMSILSIVKSIIVFLKRDSIHTYIHTYIVKRNRDDWMADSGAELIELCIGLFRGAGLTRGSWGQKVKFRNLCCYGNEKNSKES